MNSSEFRAGYEVTVYPKVKRALTKLPKHIQNRIKAGLLNIEVNGLFPRLKSLTGEYQGTVSRRLGNYRVVLEIDHTEPKVLVVRAGHRREIYD